MSSSMSSSSCVVQYNLVEEGVIDGRSSSFRRYVAVKKDDTTTTTSTSTSKSSSKREQQQQQQQQHDVTILEWAEALQMGDTENLNRVLKEVPYDAYYFETVPVTTETASTKNFEFVVVDAPRLGERRPQFQSFRKACDETMANDDNGDDDDDDDTDNNDNGHSHNRYGCAFLNLSGDATLVVPIPQEFRPWWGCGIVSISAIPKQQHDCYTHLANFIRHGPTEQVDAIWNLVATTYIRKWNNSKNINSNTHEGRGGGEVDEDVWLSTAGNGVPWLHFRFDSFPKYYHYEPYRSCIL